MFYEETAGGVRGQYLHIQVYHMAEESTPTFIRPGYGSGVTMAYNFVASMSPRRALYVRKEGKCRCAQRMKWSEARIGLESSIIGSRRTPAARLSTVEA